MAPEVDMVDKAGANDSNGGNNNNALILNNATLNSTTQNEIGELAGFTLTSPTLNSEETTLFVGRHHLIEPIRTNAIAPLKSASSSPRVLFGDTTNNTAPGLFPSNNNNNTEDEKPKVEVMNSEDIENKNNVGLLRTKRTPTATGRKRKLGEDPLEQPSSSSTTHEEKDVKPNISQTGEFENQMEEESKENNESEPGTASEAVKNYRERKRNKQVWTEEENMLLGQQISFYNMQGKSIDWRAISTEFSNAGYNRTHTQLKRHWRVCDPNRKKGPWSVEEDMRLVEVVKELSRGMPISASLWHAVAERISGRSSKQCKERWEYKHDTTKRRGPFDEEEDRELMMLANQMQYSWTKIAKKLNRSPLDVKNRFNMLARRQAKTDERQRITRNPPSHGSHSSHGSISHSTHTMMLNPNNIQVQLPNQHNFVPPHQLVHHQIHSHNVMRQDDLYTGGKSGISLSPPPPPPTSSASPNNQQHSPHQQQQSVQHQPQFHSLLLFPNHHHNLLANVMSHAAQHQQQLTQSNTKLSPNSMNTNSTKQ